MFFFLISVDTARLVDLLTCKIMKFQLVQLLIIAAVCEVVVRYIFSYFVVVLYTHLALHKNGKCFLLFFSFVFLYSAEKRFSSRAHTTLFHLCCHCHTAWNAGAHMREWRKSHFICIIFSKAAASDKRSVYIHNNHCLLLSSNFTCAREIYFMSGEPYRFMTFRFMLCSFFSFVLFVWTCLHINNDKR